MYGENKTQREHSGKLIFINGKIMILSNIKNLSETISELLVVTFANSEMVNKVPEDQKKEVEVPILKELKQYVPMTSLLCKKKVGTTYKSVSTRTAYLVLDTALQEALTEESKLERQIFREQKHD